MLPIDTLRKFIIQHAGDERMIARRILLALYRGEVTADEAAGLLKYVFRLAYFVTVFEYLAVFLIATRGRLPDPETLTNSPRARALYPPFAVWLKQCLVDGNLSMPPVNETQGMVFVGTMLDGAESHLLSLRAADEALRVSELRRQIDEVWRAQGDRWILSSTFSSNVGHFAYAATLLTLRDAGYIQAPAIAMLKGSTRNPALWERFEPRMIDEMPPGIVYAEMISARKRYALAAGGSATMSELVSEAARRWTGASPFLTPDPDLAAHGVEALAGLGIGPDDPIVTVHVREGGYNDNLGSMMRLRDARFDTYGAAVRRLVAAGFRVVRLGDSSMAPAPAIDGLVDYPFTAAKSDRMDVYLASRCSFHIGTSSGMSFIPLMFGRPVLFTNFPTLAHLVCTPATVTLPKVLKAVSGETVPFEVFSREHADILEASDAVLHDLVLADNTAEDLAQAAEMMVAHFDRRTGRVAFPDTLFSRARAALATRPQIPDWFLDRHYPDGSV